MSTSTSVSDIKFNGKFFFVEPNFCVYTYTCVHSEFLMSCHVCVLHFVNSINYF